MNFTLLLSDFLQKIDKAIELFNENDIRDFQTEVNLLNNEDIFVDLASLSSTVSGKALWRDFVDYGVSKGRLTTSLPFL